MNACARAHTQTHAHTFFLTHTFSLFLLTYKRYSLAYTGTSIVKSLDEHYSMSLIKIRRGRDSNPNLNGVSWSLIDSGALKNCSPGSAKEDEKKFDDRSSKFFWRPESLCWEIIRPLQFWWWYFFIQWSEPTMDPFSVENLPYMLVMILETASVVNNIDTWSW